MNKELVRESPEIRQPAWLSGRGQLDEITFCKEFMTKHFVLYWEGTVYNYTVAVGIGVKRLEEVARGNIRSGNVGVNGEYGAGC